MDRHIRLFSFGGGVQSHAVMVLQAQGRLPENYDAFVFANVGADSENPATLDYIERYTKPFCAAHGLNFIEVRKTTRSGVKQTLMGEIRRQRKAVIIPARMSGGAPGNRKCTSDFKIRVIDRFVKQGEYTHATIGLGISLDEFSRMRDTHWHDVESDTAKKPRKLGFLKRREYPLIDTRLTRHACLQIIQSAGLPIPPKSSCYFCPFHKANEWVEMKRNEPALFQQAVEVERLCNAVRGDLKKDYVYLHPALVPLANAVPDQPTLPGWDDLFARPVTPETLALIGIKGLMQDGQEIDACVDGYCVT